MGQAADLRLREELSLVDEDARDLLTRGECGEQREQVRTAFKDLRGLRDANPAVNLAAAALPVVEFSREQMRLHPALDVVVVRLQQCGRLASVHCGVVEVELAHGAGG